MTAQDPRRTVRIQDIDVPLITLEYFGNNEQRAVTHVDRYFLRTPELELLEYLPTQMWNRVAAAAAHPEIDREHWTNVFRDLLDDYKFVPGGRILNNLGSGRETTPFNCYVLPVFDDRSSIFGTLKMAVDIQAKGGGIGFNFSNLRPRNAIVYSVNGKASGPCSFMLVYTEAFKTIKQCGSRHGANMGLLSVYHPDILEFINLKSSMPDPQAMSVFNISVVVDNKFLDAVENDRDWNLIWPCPDMEGARGPGKYPEPTVFRTVKAREIWDAICQSAWACGDPGLLNIDNVNDWNPSGYCERIVTVNPCSEIDLEYYDVCCLGSINLTKFVKGTSWDYDRLLTTVHHAIRFLDNVLEVPGAYPFQENRIANQASRRIGLSTIGLADAWLMQGVRYGSPESATRVSDLFKFIAREAYYASTELAKEKGAAPKCDRIRHAESEYVKRLGSDICDRVRTYGVRALAMLTSVPGGTISIAANLADLPDSVSSGIEPNFAFQTERTDGIGTFKTYHPLAKEYVDRGMPLPDYFVDAHDVTPEEHLNVMAAIQYYTDNSISKTLNLPNETTVDDISDVLLRSLRRLKSVALYRSGSRSEVLKRLDDHQVDPPDQITEESKPQVADAFLIPNPDVIDNATRYKIRLSEGNNMYVIVSNVYYHGRWRMFEIFLNVRDPLMRQWTDAIALMLSSLMRREQDIQFMLDEMASIQSPDFAVWRDGQCFKSIPCLLSDVLQKHESLLQNGYMKQPEPPLVELGSVVLKPLVLDDYIQEDALAREQVHVGLTKWSSERGSFQDGLMQDCPRCHRNTMKQEGKCRTCTACTYSTC